MSAKLSISALPLPPPSHLITHNLSPDPHTPTVVAFKRDVLRTKPSIQRRARLLAPQSHFSYVSPLPLRFPYRIEVQKEGETATNEYIEQWLVAREAIHEVHDDPPVGIAGADTAVNVDRRNACLKKHHSKNKDSPRVLIGLAETAIRDCLPNLDVGDAFETLGSPVFVPKDEIGDDSPRQPEPKSGGPAKTGVGPANSSAREELVDVLSGHVTLMSPENSDIPFAPWSLRYSGHQFGVWAGQLGDGRAISILSTPHPSDPDLIYEIQLKGVGRTPFSRTADGLAVVRSSIREFLCSEAMHALSIPTTRALSLISLPDLPVVRERLEHACVVSRVAPSFLRVGSFEALNPPQRLYFFGGGQQEGDLDALRVLGEWVARRVLRLPQEAMENGVAEGGGKAWGKALVMEAARRNARMVAGWQAYGFMHGVINTDNVSILGLTIDYGPYAFMDVFDPHHICNHSDDEGRYAYDRQPSMIFYALRSLVETLAPLIGAEMERGNKAVPAGWAKDIDPAKLLHWRTEGSQALKSEVEDVARNVFDEEYRRLMRKRLGLRRQDETDDARLIKPLLGLMEDNKLDFHSTFRLLCYFRPSFVHRDEQLQEAQRSEQHEDKQVGDDKGPLDVFIRALLRLTPHGATTDAASGHNAVSTEWKQWLQAYAARIEAEKDEWVDAGGGSSGSDEDADVDRVRELEMRAANPRFVLRQWLLEEVIRLMEADADVGKRVLGKVLKMACSPFEQWGAERDERPSFELEAEIREERRYCGMGAKNMLGFQCSCSS